jgi:hypothetical protein
MRKEARASGATRVRGERCGITGRNSESAKAGICRAGGAPRRLRRARACSENARRCRSLLRS